MTEDSLRAGLARPRLSIRPRGKDEATMQPQARSAAIVSLALLILVCAGACERKAKPYERRTYQSGEVHLSRSDSSDRFHWISGKMTVTIHDEYVGIDKSGNDGATEDDVWWIPRDRITYIGPAGAFESE